MECIYRQFSCTFSNDFLLQKSLAAEEFMKRNVRPRYNTSRSKRGEKCSFRKIAKLCHYVSKLCLLRWIIEKSSGINNHRGNSITFKVKIVVFQVVQVILISIFTVLTSFTEIIHCFRLYAIINREGDER